MHNPAHISFRPVAVSDLPQLHTWSQASHVLRWWDAPASFGAFAEWVTPIVSGQNPRHPYLILYEGEPIGYIHFFRIRDVQAYRQSYALDEEAAGIDLYIGDTRYLYQGLGRHIVERFLDHHVFTDPALESCVIGPDPENCAAIRAYEKAGFHYLKTVDIQDLDERQYLMRMPRSRGADAQRPSSPG